MSIKQFMLAMTKSRSIENMKTSSVNMNKIDVAVLHKFILAVEQLREAQKMYMANRGNEEIGAAVGAAAVEVDRLLVEINREEGDPTYP